MKNSGNIVVNSPINLPIISPVSVYRLAIILLITFLAYSNIFRNGFVIDDQYFIADWDMTRSWSNAGQLLKGANPQTQPGVYRPIRGLLYLVYFQLFGANPFFYHLHSILVHLISTVLVYLILSELWLIVIPRDPPAGGPRGNLFQQIATSQTNLPRLAERDPAPQDNDNPAFIGALLFGLHPIHTESITYIAASMEMTGVMFMLGSFYLYIKIFNFKFLIFKRFKIARVLSLLLALLAFFTYEMTLTLPLLILWYEFTLGRSRRSGGLGKSIGYWTGALGYLAVRFGLGVGLARGDYLAFSPYHTFLTMTKMAVNYIQLLIWPVTLSHNHTIVPGFEAFMTPYSDQGAILRQSIFDPEILISITVITVIMVITVIFRKKFPLLSFSLGWFFISLLPVLYIFPQGTAIAEKYLYLGSVGFVMVAAWGLGRLGGLGKMGAIGVGIVILFYGLRTFARNQNWRSPVTLWEYEAKIHPKSELAFYLSASGIVELWRRRPKILASLILPDFRVICSLPTGFNICLWGQWPKNLP